MRYIVYTKGVANTCPFTRGHHFAPSDDEPKMDPACGDALITIAGSPGRFVQSKTRKVAFKNVTKTENINMFPDPKRNVSKISAGFQIGSNKMKNLSLFIFFLTLPLRKSV